MTVFETCRELGRHPVRQLIHQWNWKNAVFTALIRGAVFFATNLVAGVPAAVRALAVDALFRVPLSGIYAAVTQALTSAQPRWAALLVIAGLVPAFGHVVEFGVHWLSETPELRISILASVTFSAASTLFNLFSMERGVFLVGAAARPFREDLKRLPALLLDFLLAPARRLHRRRSGATLLAGCAVYAPAARRLPACARSPRLAARLEPRRRVDVRCPQTLSSLLCL